MCAVVTGFQACALPIFQWTGAGRRRYTCESDRRARKQRNRTAWRIFIERRDGPRCATARGGPCRSQAARPRASCSQISEPARNSVNPAAYTPKLLTVFREGYSAATFRVDAIAGLTVAIVALPLAMALGIASGASPAKGLITAALAGFMISALGGSRGQVGGPPRARTEERRVGAGGGRALCTGWVP